MKRILSMFGRVFKMIEIGILAFRSLFIFHMEIPHALVISHHLLTLFDGHLLGVSLEEILLHFWDDRSLPQEFFLDKERRIEK